MKGILSQTPSPSEILSKILFYDHAWYAHELCFLLQRYGIHLLEVFFTSFLRGDGRIKHENAYYRVDKIVKKINIKNINKSGNPFKTRSKQCIFDMLVTIN